MVLQGQGSCDILTGAVETTPLISQSSLGSRRPRSHAYPFSFLPKRRIRTKGLLKPSNQPSMTITSTADTNAGREGEHEYSSCTPSNPTATSHSSVCSADNSACLGLNDAAKQHPPLPQPSPFSSILNLNLLSVLALRLENSGSVARDHLASERTFLAYMRTSLAIASSGVALVQLFTVASASSDPLNLTLSARKLHSYARPLGAAAVIMGLIVLVIGVIRYFTIQTALTKGYFPVARIAIAAIALALTVLVTLTFGLLVSGKLASKALGGLDLGS